MFHDETMPSFFRRPSFSPDGSLLLVPGRKLKDTKNQQKYLYVTKDTSVKAYKSYAVAKKFHLPFPLHHICVYGIKYLPCTLLFYYLSWLAAGRIDIGDQVVNTTYVFTRASPNKWVKVVSLHLFSIRAGIKNRESSRESRLATDCQLTFEQYCSCLCSQQDTKRFKSWASIPMGVSNGR